MTATPNTLGPIPKVDVGSLRAELAANPDRSIVDGRTRGEFQTGHMDGSINLPLDQMDANLQRIASDAAGRMVLICQSGGRAMQAADKLAGAGLADVAVLDGGLKLVGRRGSAGPMS